MDHDAADVNSKGPHVRFHGRATANCLRERRRAHLGLLPGALCLPGL